MPLLTELFPQRTKAPGRSACTGVCVLPSIPESPVLQGPSRSPRRTRRGPSRLGHPLRKVFPPHGASGSEPATDSFIYESWRVHPRGPAPRRAFEDQSPSVRPPSCVRPPLLPEHSVSREVPGDRRRGNRARRCSGGCPTVIGGGRGKGCREKEEGQALTEAGNKMEALSVLNFCKRCKINCWNKMSGCSVFKA